MDSGNAVRTQLKTFKSDEVSESVIYADNQLISLYRYLISVIVLKKSMLWMYGLLCIKT